MPVISINLPDKKRRITFVPGRSVRDILDETDIRVRTGCNGTGACGMCRIRIADGKAGMPSMNEQTALGTALLSQGVRLACQVNAYDDLEIELLNPAPRSAWRCLDQGETTLYVTNVTLPEREVDHLLGISVDIGTTHISITLLDFLTGNRIAGRVGPNPQAGSGSDIMTRLVSAETCAQAEKLSHQVVLSIADGLHDIGSREGINLKRVARVAVVGNTAMLALLSGRNYRLLLQPRYWSEFIDCQPEETISWGEMWGLAPEAVIEIVPPLAGFVGSDLLAGVIATHLIEHGRGALHVDFGTNTEMALWDGSKLWVTSAAGGPAFEGCGISCGMTADPGAIFRVRASQKGNRLSFEVIADAAPRGLCGSGLVDLISCLLGNGSLNSKGQFALSMPGYGLPLHSGKEIVLTKKDVDILQRAKAAIGAAFDALLTNADMDYSELMRVYISGAFGRHLDISNACELGLLPAIPERCFETVGNAALSGCEALLISSKARALLQEVRNRAVIINMAADSNFEAHFLENLYLRPITGNRGHDRIDL